MTFSKPLEKTNFISAPIETSNQVDVSIRLLNQGYKREIVSGSVRGEWSEEAGCLVYLYDALYKDPKGILPDVTRVESLTSIYK